MLFVHEIQDFSFIVLRASLPAGQACELVADATLTHVIVHRLEAAQTYYLFTVHEALPRLYDAAAKDSVAVALELDQCQPVPVIDAYADGETAPDRAVVVDRRHVTGYLDLTVPPLSLGGTKGGFGEPGGGAYMGVPGAPISSGLPGGPTRSISEAEAQPVPRSMVTQFPERVRLGDTAVLKVLLSAAVQAGGVPLAAPLGSEIMVVVEPVQRFRLVGAGEGVLHITGEPETLPLRFQLEATETGDGRIDVYAYQGVQPLGRAVVSATVVGANEPDDLTEGRQDHALAAISVHQPDLALIVIQKPRGTQFEYKMQLKTLEAIPELTTGVFGPVSFTGNPEAYFEQFFKSIEDEPLDTPEQRGRIESILEAKGNNLFQTFFPEDLQALLWRYWKRVKTVQIVSGDPWIPWEMCKLINPVKPYKQGPYFCEAFAVTRWKNDVEIQPALTLNNVALVVPEDSGLEHAPAERDYLLSLSDGGRAVSRIPAQLVKVMRALQSGQYDGWHFSGHGRHREGTDPNFSVIALEDQAELTPEYLSSCRNLGQAHPLVFLNACNVGRRAMSLTDVGGWADKFLWAGAAAFIGAHWSIDDGVAYDFAKLLYSKLLDDGLPIGEAVRESRLAVREAYPGDPTWLAYTVFASPMARVEGPT
jgi:hypothetical protein